MSYEENPDAPELDTEMPRLSSRDLLAQAWTQLGGHTAAGDGSSDDLIRRARWWLEERDEAPEVATAGAEIAVAAATREAMEEEGGFDDLSRVFEAPAERPTRRDRPRPQPLPTTAAPDAAARPPRRAAWLLVAAILGVAVFANIVIVLVGEGDDAPSPTIGVPATTSPVTTAGPAAPWVDTARSEGSLTVPWTDPCSGAAIDGGLDTEITYTEDAGDSSLSVLITGDLEGEDGAAYDLVIRGSASGEPAGTYVIDSGSLTMTRDDGTVISAPVEITVEVVDRSAGAWEFGFEELTCQG
jgi:hypothetical protein